ncbi:AraC family transcriptional regulator [Oscillospiraceae bacterium PP1C4]
MMQLHDSSKYKEIPLITMSQNPNGNLPVFIRKYDNSGITRELHRHQMIQINYILSGSVEHLINNAAFEVARGDIFVIPPYIPHRLIPIEQTSFEIIELEFSPDFVWGTSNIMENIETFFDFAYIEPFLVSEGEVKPRLNLGAKKMILIEEIFHEIFREYTEQADGYLLAIKADLLKLLVYVGRCFKENMDDFENRLVFEHHHQAIINVIIYINENYIKDITIEDAAKMAMLSRSYFCYLFKIISGSTFIEYLNERRIYNASEMLKHSQTMITQICFDVGFNNVSHFNRVFKSIMGISPRQYRVMYENKEH